MTPRTVPELLAARAAADPDRCALIAGRRSVTYAEWDARATAVAAGLRARGVRAGERVGLLFGNPDWVDFAVAYCGTLRAAAVAVPLSDRLAPAEVRGVLADCAATAVVHATGATAPDGPAPAAPLSDVERAGVGRAGTGGAGWDPAGPDDPAQVLYTSGTTGRPKGVTATHANLAYGATTDPRRRPLAHSAHFLHAFPVGTNAGQTMLLTALSARPTAIAAARFTPGYFARLIEEYAVGTVFLVPAMAIELLRAGVPERHDLSSVVLVGSTAAALPPAVATALAAAFPNATITNTYTSTEAAPAQTTMVFDPDRPASLGRAASRRDLRIAGAEGAPLPPGAVGDVWLRCPTTPRAYYGDHAGTGAVFRDGWVRMGDLGYLDDEGYLYLVDRDSDVVKSGAFKVSTLQVESALHEHPDIVEAAVLGVPHPVLGNAVAAVVVPRGDLSTRTLRAFLTERLADHELPAQILLRPSLPRNPAGKVLKRELRTLFTDAEAGR